MSNCLNVAKKTMQIPLENQFDVTIKLIISVLINIAFSKIIREIGQDTRIRNVSFMIRTSNTNIERLLYVS